MVKRSTAVLIGIAALLLGLACGFSLHWLLPSRSAAMLTSTLSVSSSAEEDKSALIGCALETANAIQKQDFALLASYIHPEEGVTFTPNTTVDRSTNLTFTSEQIAQASAPGESYLWGTATDTASPISLTISDYFSSYVWDVDYLTAPSISVDSVRITGNALENTADAYPDCHYVEFYFSGENAQTDWRCLKLVYEWYNGGWYLVGVVHSSWSA